MADSGFEELERHFEAATLALGRGDRSAAVTELRAIVREAEVRDDAVEPLTLALTRLGELELEEGREADAEGYFQRALALGERRLGAEHPDLVVMLNALSRLYLRRGAHELAEPILQRLHTIKRAKGEDHPEVATVLASLANVRQHLGRYDAAEQLWRRVLDIRERTLAPNHVATASAIERLAETCAARAKAGEAVQLMQRALAMRELTLGGTHPTVRALRERIADLQLQAADDDGDLGPLMPITAPTAIPGWRAPTPAAVPPTIVSPVVPPAVPSLTSQALPPVAAPVAAAPFGSAPAAPAAPHAPAPMAATSRTPESNVAVAAPRAITIPYAPPLPATIPAGDATAGEQAARPQLALVLPGTSAESGLTIQQLLAQIDAEEEAAASQPGIATRAATLFREHRGPAIIAGVVLLLGAAFTVAKARGTGDEGDLAAELTRTSAPTATAIPALDAPRYGADGVVPSAATGTAVTAASLAGAGMVGTDERRAAEATPRHEAATAPAAASAPRSEEKAREASRPTTAAAAPSIPSLPQVRLDDITRAASAATATASQDPLAGRLASVSAKSARIGAVASTTTSTASTQPARLVGAVPVARYPQSLRQSGVEGEVRVTFEVDTLGRPDMRTLAILKSDHELFTRAVRGVIPEMRFVPAEADGKKTRWLVRMPFVFSVGPR